MGFTLEEILEALKATNGNVELAAALLNERKYGFWEFINKFIVMIQFYVIML